LKFKKFFAVEANPQGSDDPEGWGVKVIPSKYLQQLPPHKAIAELQSYVDTLKDVLRHCRQTFTDEDLESRTPALAGYKRGVPMGADLPPRQGAKAPSFMVYALRDPIGGNLDRIQIVKGWLDASGNTHEKVYDVVWGDTETRKPGSDGKLPAVGNTVDVKNATWANTIGDPELIAVWEDPDFDAALKAFYYVRVMEIPTPRWTAYDAKRYGITDMPNNVNMILQERAYTSPIWYTP
jgi:hypothetical protein